MDTTTAHKRGRGHRAPIDAQAMTELREARIAKGMTLSTIAKAIGSSRQWVHRMETARRPCPPATLVTWRALLGLALALMLVGCGAEPCDHPESIDELCAQWQGGRCQIVESGDWLVCDPLGAAWDDLGGELCL